MIACEPLAFLANRLSTLERGTKWQVRQSPDRPSHERFVRPSAGNNPVIYSMAIKMGERFDLPITATPLHGRSELIDATTALAYKGNTDGIRVDVHVCKGDVFDLRFGWHYTPAISACHPRTL
jgi:hypothetical protein